MNVNDVVVHIHALFSYAAIPASAFALRSGVSYVIRPLGTLNRFGMERRRPLLKRWSYRFIERRILAGAARVHYTSEAERREAELVNAPGRPVVIPHGIDLDRFRVIPTSGWLRQRAPHLEDRTTIIFLSRLDEKKGLDLLFPAFAKVKAARPDVALVIAGDGDAPFVRTMRAYADRLGVANDIYWPGLLDDEEKRAALADSDVFVLPSYSENFGLSVVEAMATSLPVVISDRVAIHCEVASAEAGLITACDDTDLARALLAFVNNPEMRRRFGDAGRRLARDRFSADAMCAATLGMYDEILQTRILSRAATAKSG